MGAPPGVGDASSATRPATNPLLTTPPPEPAKPAPRASDSATTKPSEPDTRFKQNPVDPLKLMGIDESRRQLTKGLRLYQDRHLDTAKIALDPVRDNFLAKEVLKQIGTRETFFHARQIAFVLKALGRDAAGTCAFTEAQSALLDSAIESVENYLVLHNSNDLNKAIAETRAALPSDVQKVWDCFASHQQTAIAELSAAFLETDPELLADNLLRLAEQYRDRKHYGTSWALAQIAAEYPKTQGRAKELSAYLEGKRTSTEYVLSDMFDHGGSSIAIDLLALIPSIALTRRLSTVAWLANRSAFVRIPATLLAGGLAHWGSTKAIKGLSGFDGQIMPRSFRQLGGELASSTLQNGFALLLANRKLFWGSPASKKEIANATSKVAVVEGTEAATAANGARAGLAPKILRGGQLFGKSLFWTAKTSLKVGIISTGDLLLVKTPLHYFKIHDMTQQGLPQYAMWLFPSARDARQAVKETYSSRNLYRQYQKSDAISAKLPNSIPQVDPALDLDVLMTKLDPSLAGDKREAAYAVLAEAAASGKLGLNIRRWIFQKKKMGEWEGANRTFERQSIPLRYDAEGTLCFIDSENFACPESPATKP